MTQTDSTAPIKVCSLGDLAAGMGREFDIQGRTIAVFLTSEGQVYATDNSCPHRDGPLAAGTIDGASVMCPFHSYCFEFATGKCDQPGINPVKIYPVEIRDNDVFIRFPT